MIGKLICKAQKLGVDNENISKLIGKLGAKKIEEYLELKEEDGKLICKAQKLGLNNVFISYLIGKLSPEKIEEHGIKEGFREIRL